MDGGLRISLDLVLVNLSWLKEYLILDLKNKEREREVFYSVYKSENTTQWSDSNWSLHCAVIYLTSHWK